MNHLSGFREKLDFSRIFCFFIFSAKPSRCSSKPLTAF